MYAELINQGVQVVGGIVNFTTDIFAKLNAGKLASQQAIKDKFIASENIAKAYSAVYSKIFQSMTEGASGAAWSTVKSYWEYMKNNPLATDKKALLSGAPQPIYLIEFVPEGNSSKIVLKTVLRKVTSPTTFVDSNPVIVKTSPLYANDIPLIQQRVILPASYATEKSKSEFDYLLYERALKFISGTNTTALTQADVDKWKGGLPSVPDVPSGGNMPPPPSGGTDFPIEKSETNPKQGSSSMLIILAVLGIAGYYFFFKKK